MTIIRKIAIVGIAVAITGMTGCGGPSQSEQALIQIALTKSELVNSIDEVEQIASDICSDQDGEDSSSVVFSTREEASIARVFCPDLTENALTRDDAYLEALSDAGVTDEFAADRAALVAAERTCDELDQGGPPQGSEAEQIAVQWFCDEYVEAFKVLDVIDVSGSFTINTGESFPSICVGEGGYGDLNSSTKVLIRDREGSELARTELGLGLGNGDSCEFEFTLSDVREGAPGNVYIVEVGDRGEISYTFDELRIPGIVALTIGSQL